MKKLLTVSLVAMMAVSAAHADLASTAYVKGKTGDLQYSSGLQPGEELKYVANSDVLTTAVAKLDQAIKTVGGDLDDLVVTTDGIADSAVTTAKIADNAVTSGKIADGEVKTDDIANDAITSEKIKNGEVKTDDIADLNVTTGKIADSAVTSGKILDGTIAIADLSSEVTGMMEGHQLKSNIQTVTNHTLSSAEQDVKYTSVSYVDTKIRTATQNLPTLGEDVETLKDEVVEMKKTDTALETAIGVNADDIGLAKNEAGEVTSFTETEYLKGATTLTGAAVELDAKIKGLSDDKQAKLSDQNVTSTGEGVVKTVVGENGALTVTRDLVGTADIKDENVTTAKIADSAVTTLKIADEAVTSEKIKDGEVKTADIADLNVTTAKIADKNVTKAKLADDVQTLIDGALPRSTLEGAAKMDADKGDGEYALTMKVENGVMTYQWDLISY